MACLTSGVANPCGAKVSGGSNFIYLAEKADVATVTVGAGGDITAIAMVGLAVFYKFEFDKKTGAVFTEDLTNETATQVLQQYVMDFKGRSNVTRNAVMELAACDCGLVVIHGENTGAVWLWGFDETEEAFLLGSASTSGRLKSDANIETPTLQAMATEKARVFTPGLAGIPV